MRTALLLCLLSTPALSQDWPREVADVVAKAQSICQGKFTAAPEAVTQRDLNGDGTPDWVVDSGAFQCSDGYSTYCGTAGCSVETVIDGVPGSLLLHSWETVTENGTTYLTGPSRTGETARYLWIGSQWELQ